MKLLLKKPLFSHNDRIKLSYESTQWNDLMQSKCETSRGSSSVRITCFFQWIISQCGSLPPPLSVWPAHEPVLSGARATIMPRLSTVFPLSEKRKRNSSFTCYLTVFESDHALWGVDALISVSKHVDNQRFPPFYSKRTLRHKRDLCSACVNVCQSSSFISTSNLMLSSPLTDAAQFGDVNLFFFFFFLPTPSDVSQRVSGFTGTMSL